VSDSPAPLLHGRLRNLLDNYGDDLARFTAAAYGEEALLAAWDEFNSWDPDTPALDDDIDELSLFSSWFFHVWAPERYEDPVDDPALYERTPSSVYLERKAEQLDPLLRQYLDACTRLVPSFYTVLRCDRERGFRLRDVITGDECEVVEISASHDLEVDDVIYALVVDVAGISVIEAVGETVIPPLHKIGIIELRQQLFGERRRIDRDELLDVHIEFRELYLAIAARIRQPVPRHMQNTDGDPIEPRKMVFDLAEPADAYHALKHLDAAASDTEHEQLIKRDAAGILTEVEFHWTRPDGKGALSDSGTMLGVIRIVGNRLTAEVNSRRRADKLRGIIERKLGKGVTFRMAEVVPLETHMERVTTRSPRHRDPGLGQAEIAQLPEVRDALRKMMAAHYETWPDEKIPALGNVTPRQAARTSEGREKVEALLTQYERDDVRQPFPVDPEIFQTLRQKLGLK
jgi:hypothetical protein